MLATLHSILDHMQHTRCEEYGERSWERCIDRGGKKKWSSPEKNRSEPRKVLHSPCVCHSTRRVVPIYYRNTLYARRARTLSRLSFPSPSIAVHISPNYFPKGVLCAQACFPTTNCALRMQSMYTRRLRVVQRRKCSRREKAEETLVSLSLLFILYMSSKNGGKRH